MRIFLKKYGARKSKGRKIPISKSFNSGGNSICSYVVVGGQAQILPRRIVTTKVWGKRRSTCALGDGVAAVSYRASGRIQRSWHGLLDSLSLAQVETLVDVLLASDC